MTKRPQVEGKKVVGLREKRFLSRDELAERAGLTRSSLQRIEQAKDTTIALKTMRKLAKGLGVTPDELAGLIAPSSSEVSVSLRRDLFDALSRIAARDGITVQQFLEETVADDIDENLEAVSPLKPDSPAAAKREDIRGRDTVAANEQAG